MQWEYVWDGDKLIYMYDGTAEWRFIYDAGGSIVGFMQGASTYYYKKNIQGDVTAIFDNNFNEVVTYEYDSWGNLINQGGSKAAAYVKLGKDNPIRYRGYFYDTDTGLYYLQSRYYNAAWGRFVNADGVVISNLGIYMHNLFTYCSNNPNRFVDPTGTCPCAWEAYCTCKDCPYYQKKIGKYLSEKAIAHKAKAQSKSKFANNVQQSHVTSPTYMIDAGSFYGKIGFSTTTQTYESEEPGAFYRYVDFGEDVTNFGLGLNATDWFGADIGVTSNYDAFVKAQVTPLIHGSVSLGSNGVGISLGVDDNMNNSYDFEFKVGVGTVATIVCLAGIAIAIASGMNVPTGNRTLSPQGA